MWYLIGCVIFMTYTVYVMDTNNFGLDTVHPSQLILECNVGTMRMNLVLAPSCMELLLLPPSLGILSLPDENLKPEPHPKCLTVSQSNVSTFTHTHTHSPYFLLLFIFYLAQSRGAACSALMCSQIIQVSTRSHTCFFKHCKFKHMLAWCVEAKDWNEPTSLTIYLFY